MQENSTAQSPQSTSPAPAAKPRPDEKRTLQVSFPIESFLLFAGQEESSDADLMSILLNYNAVRLAVKFRDENGHDRFAARASTIAAIDGVPNDYESKNPEHNLVIVGAYLAHLILPSAKAALKNFDRLQAFTEKHKNKFGGSPWACVHRDLLFEVRDGSGIHPREFRVLCGISSIIGTKKFKRITRPFIAMRAAGFKSSAVVSALAEKHQVDLLTDWKVTDTVKKLRRRNLLNVCRPNKRETFYAERHRCSQGDLEKMVIARKTRGKLTDAGFTQRDANVSQAVKALLGGRPSQPQFNLH